MNTYDPADYIVYVHVARETPRPAGSGPHEVEHLLPRGYADASPRTRLRGRAPARPSTGHGHLGVVRSLGTAAQHIS